MPKHPQMTLYIHDDVRAAVQEVADEIHGNLSPTARHLLLDGLKVERARLGLPEVELHQATKSRADAEAQGVQTRGQRDAAASRARRATGAAPAPARIRPRRPSDPPLPTREGDPGKLGLRPVSGGVWLPPDITQIDPIPE